MRGTIYLGNEYQHDDDKPLFRQRDYDDGSRRGDDMPVFDRHESGGRGEFERPWNFDQTDDHADGYSKRRITRADMRRALR